MIKKIPFIGWFLCEDKRS